MRFDMKQRTQQMRLQPMGLLATACSMAMMLGLAPAGVAQQAAKQQPAAAVSAKPVAVATNPVGEEEEAATPKKPGGEGIKVHGHWVMDIRNADGTLAKHLDFQNSLTTGGSASTALFSSGDQLLAAVLSGTIVLSDPGIYFVGYTPSSATLPPGDPSNACTSTSQCSMFSTAQGLYALANAGYGGWLEFDPVQTGLVTTVNFSPNVSWVLSGNWTVPNGMTSLTAVQTWLSGCTAHTATLFPTSTFALGGSTGDGTASAIRGNDCTAASILADGANPNTPFGVAGSFTSTVVPGAPLTIAPGEVITVTVTITFS
jgi:hypothetical protein